jgi:hypothetical protein
MKFQAFRYVSMEWLCVSSTTIFSTTNSLMVEAVIVYETLQIHSILTQLIVQDFKVLNYTSHEFI